MNLVKNIILEITKYFEKNSVTEDEVEILKMIKNVPLNQNNFIDFEPNMPPKTQAYQEALSSIKLDYLLGIKGSLEAAARELKWNVDNGDFYDINSLIGESYLLGNMNAELIGPKYGMFRSTELRLGLFLLESNIFYKDHKHKAPELYLNLTGGTKWRFDDLNWQVKHAGSIIYNKPYQLHAMKVGCKPFLSVWCWPKDSNEKCILVHRKDWDSFIN